MVVVVVVVVVDRLDLLLVVAADPSDVGGVLVALTEVGVARILTSLTPTLLVEAAAAVQAQVQRTTLF